MGVTLGRTCSVCAHLEVGEINKALVQGGGYRPIAERFGISYSAVGRHFRKHLPVAIAKAAEAGVIAEAGDLLGQGELLRDKAYSALLKAEEAGDLSTVLKAVREARGCLELLAKLRGELDTQTVTVNVLQQPQWIEIRAVLLDALGPYPGAKVAVATALLETEGDGRGN